MGMRCVLVSGLNKFGPALEVMEERYNTLNGMPPLISYMLGVHAEYTCSKELLEQVSEMVHKSVSYTHLKNLENLKAEEYTALCQEYVDSYSGK